MATSKIAVTEGSGKNIATVSISEDAVTKELQRVVPVDITGANALPLPTGASTESTLSTLNGKVTACNTGAVTVSSAPVTHVIIDSGNPTSITANAGTNLNTSALATSAQVGEVQASPTQYTVLDRLKALMTGIVLSAGSALIGKVGIDQTTPGTTNAVASTPVALGTRVRATPTNHTDTTTAREVVAAIASNYVYVTSFIISVAVAGEYWLEDGDGTQLTGKFQLAVNGCVSWTGELTTALKTNTVNKAINVKGSVSGKVAVFLTGYQSTT